MKISIICLALATVLSVAGAAVINQDECFAEGGPCHTLKRAASALAEANIFDGQHHNTAHHQCEDAGAICYKSKRDVCGPSCLKAKRDALALAEAFAEAAPFAEPIHRQCFGSGGICYKAKRDAVEAAADFADAEASTDPDTQDGTPVLLSAHYFMIANISHRRPSLPRNWRTL